MKIWINAFILSLCIVFAPAFARQEKQPIQLNEVTAWSAMTYEQQAVASWIAKVNNVGLSFQQIANIVKTTYRYADYHQIDPHILFAIMRIESRFNPNATSNHGAKGIMQVMAKVHRGVLAGRSPYNYQTSIEVGTGIFKDCLERANGNVRKALSYYSGGGGRAYYSLVLSAKSDMSKHVVQTLFAGGPTMPLLRGSYALN